MDKGKRYKHNGTPRVSKKPKRYELGGQYKITAQPKTKSKVDRKEGDLTHLNKDGREAEVIRLATMAYADRDVRLQPQPNQVMPDVYQLHTRPKHQNTREDLDWVLVQEGQIDKILKCLRTDHGVK